MDEAIINERIGTVSRNSNEIAWIMDEVVGTAMRMCGSLMRQLEKQKEYMDHG